MESTNALVLVFERNTFYRRQYMLALLAFAISVIVIIVLSGMVYYLYKNPTRPLFFAADNVGRLIDIIPVDQPNMSDDAVANWTIRAVQAAYSYDFVNYRSQLQATQKYFTNYGWAKYMDALTLSNNLLSLGVYKQIVIATVISKPIILNKGILAGAFAWKIDLPILITYLIPPYDMNSPASKNNNAVTVSVIVQRQPILQSVDGLGILQFISTFTSNTNAPQMMTNPPPP